ncbi:unnamed protein product [Gadus morhua 'NCC']
MEVSRLRVSPPVARTHSVSDGPQPHGSSCDAIHPSLRVVNSVLRTPHQGEGSGSDPATHERPHPPPGMERPERGCWGKGFRRQQEPLPVRHAAAIFSPCQLCQLIVCCHGDQIRASIPSDAAEAPPVAVVNGPQQPNCRPRDQRPLS